MNLNYVCPDNKQNFSMSTVRPMKGVENTSTNLTFEPIAQTNSEKVLAADKHISRK